MGAKRRRTPAKAHVYTRIRAPPCRSSGTRHKHPPGPHWLYGTPLLAIGLCLCAAQCSVPSGCLTRAARRKHQTWQRPTARPIRGEIGPWDVSSRLMSMLPERF